MWPSIRQCAKRAIDRYPPKGLLEAFAIVSRVPGTIFTAFGQKLKEDIFRVCTKQNVAMLLSINLDPFKLFLHSSKPELCIERTNGRCAGCQ